MHKVIVLEEYRALRASRSHEEMVGMVVESWWVRTVTCALWLGALVFVLMLGAF